MESLTLNSNEDHAPQEFDKNHMQKNLTLLSAKELEVNKTDMDCKNNAIFLSNKISKSSDPLHNNHIVEFEVTKGGEYGDGLFFGYIGLISETNVSMLKKECMFY